MTQPSPEEAREMLADIDQIARKCATLRPPARWGQIW